MISHSNLTLQVCKEAEAEGFTVERLGELLHHATSIPLMAPTAEAREDAELERAHARHTIRRLPSGPQWLKAEEKLLALHREKRVHRVGVKKT